MKDLEKDSLRQAVRENYKKIALEGEKGDACCSTNCCSPNEKLGVDLEELNNKFGYTSEEFKSVPAESNMGLGCGNPQAIAKMKSGEVVVDLGSGGGFDCFLASKQVGENGQVIGVDMTPEMISKARSNADKQNYTNVEFRLGEIENLPVANEVADVIISNCVINLSPDKPQVFKEAYRVLKNGGRLAISDIVLTTELPDEVKGQLKFYSGCVVGASTVSDLTEFISLAGFKNVKIVPKDESHEFIREWSPEYKLEEYIISAVIEAVK